MNKISTNSTARKPLQTAARSNKSVGRALSKPAASRITKSPKNVTAAKPAPAAKKVEETKVDTRTKEEVDAAYEAACAKFDKAAANFRAAADQKAKEIALALTMDANRRGLQTTG